MTPFRRLALCLFALSVSSARAIDLEQVISLEHPDFRCERSRFNVGRDGLLYWYSGGNDSVVLRAKPDGSGRFGGQVVYAARGVAANRDGTIATANAHFAHAVTVYDSRLKQVGAVNDFLVNDQFGYSAPCSVEAGASGDFYGGDLYRERILRIGADGKLLRGYPTAKDDPASKKSVQEFRVAEKTESFVLLRVSGPLICQGFDGKIRWTLPAGLHSTDGSLNGGFDLDASGNLYLIEPKSDTVQIFGPDGKPLRKVVLKLGDVKPKPEELEWSDLRVGDGELFLRRRHLTELAQVFSSETGERKRVIATRHQKLTVSFPDRVWLAGKETAFAIKMTGEEGIASPRFRVWLRPFGELGYRELTPKDGKLTVPDDLAGIYLLKVTPEVVPLQREEKSDLGVWTWVEIRGSGKATATVWTDRNRTAFAQGEAVKCFVSLKGEPKSLTAKFRVSDGKRVLAEEAIELNRDRPAEITLPAALTSALKPGDYRLAAEADGVNPVALTIRIGLGGHTAFPRMQYGDYGLNLPETNLWDAVDRVAAYSERLSRLGIDTVVDRLGMQPTAGQLDSRSRQELNEILKYLEKEPLAPSPERYRFPSTVERLQSLYSAAGIEQRAILMGNDAGLPLGTGFDNRKPEKLLQDLTTVTEMLKPYPSFKGWSWSSNWWIFDGREWNGGRTPEEKKACEAAYKRARQDGIWDPILDTVSDIRFGYAVEAQAMFNRKLKELAPNAVTSSACPHRNVESYPPVSLGNVDEVDLQAQWEQIPMPYAVMHGVDFYSRPGKKSWTHPEIWNDCGTGDQIVPNLFSAVMRGVNGVGHSGQVPPWTQDKNSLPDDPRGGHYGTASVFRAFYEMLKNYGPWLNELENDDRVAIVVSGRMLRIDDWPRVYGTHFARLFEAYMTCMFAGHPASYVFVEDLKPGLLKKYKAILVVGQRVELEPQLKAALKEAQQAGATVFHDGNCRPEWVTGFEPLGIRFNQFEKDHSPAADDHAYWRFPKYCLKYSPILKSILDPVTKPPYETDNPEVFGSIRKNGDDRYLFLVNQTTSDVPPGKLWRMNLECTNRKPVVATVKIAPGLLKGGVVLNILSGEYLPVKDGAVAVDLRHFPAAILAFLPEKLPLKITLSLPKTVALGERFAWSARIENYRGPRLLPVRVQLSGPEGDSSDSIELMRDGRVEGKLIAPLASAIEEEEGDPNANPRPKPKVAWPYTRAVFNIWENFGDAWGTSVIGMTGHDSLPKPIARFQSGDTREPNSAAERDFTGFSVSKFVGPRPRSVSVSPDGRRILFTALSWDHNLLIRTPQGAGSGRFSQARVGDSFAFNPVALQKGFAVQGFDFDSAAGYHLYLLDEDGKVERRFALYGLTHRQVHRFVPNIFKEDRHSFAVPEEGTWVASAGNLGVCAWKRNGTLLWAKPGRDDAEVRLLPLDEKTLIACRGTSVHGLNPLTGNELWKHDLAETGSLRDLRRSADGKTLAILTTTEGGRVFLIRDGKLTHTLHATGTNLAVSPDGSSFATTEGGRLRFYSAQGGFRWSFQGDGFLTEPNFSPEGERIAFGSDLGTMTVLDLDGRRWKNIDSGYWSPPGWSPDGSLLTTTGRSKIPPPSTASESPPKRQAVPTAQAPAWTNSLPSPLPLKDNLLDPMSVAIRHRDSGGNLGFILPPEKLVDGDLSPPGVPWLDWAHINFMAENFKSTEIQFDTFRTQLRLEAITLVEDAAHPESWVREATVESWNPAAEKWVAADRLLSDSAVHSHRLAKPLEASRFRLVLPPGRCGNLRLAEVVFHGKKLGSNHPDVIAKKPVAVLFDEQQDFRNSMMHLKSRFEGSYSGGLCLEVEKDQTAYPLFIPPFGHVVPGWDFEIAEKPGPGQYRYAQFAWKAGSPETTGIALRFDGGAFHRKAEVVAGTTKPFEAGKRVVVAERPPAEWKTVRVDLWEMWKEPGLVRGVELRCSGGPALFDQILLGRTEADLPPVGK